MPPPVQNRTEGKYLRITSRGRLTKERKVKSRRNARCWLVDYSPSLLPVPVPVPEPTLPLPFKNTLLVPPTLPISPNPLPALSTGLLPSPSPSLTIVRDGGRNEARLCDGVGNCFGLSELVLVLGLALYEDVRRACPIMPSTHASLSALRDVFRDFDLGPARPRGVFVLDEGRGGS